jgi:hypothetical protein
MIRLTIVSPEIVSKSPVDSTGMYRLAFNPFKTGSDFRVLLGKDLFRRLLGMIIHCSILLNCMS